MNYSCLLIRSTNAIFRVCQNDSIFIYIWASLISERFNVGSIQLTHSIFYPVLWKINEQSFSTKFRQKIRLYIARWEHFLLVFSTLFASSSLAHNIFFFTKTTNHDFFHLIFWWSGCKDRCIDTPSRFPWPISIEAPSRYTTRKCKRKCFQFAHPLFRSFSLFLRPSLFRFINLNWLGGKNLYIVAQRRKQKPRLTPAALGRKPEGENYARGKGFRSVQLWTPSRSLRAYEEAFFHPFCPSIHLFPPIFFSQFHRRFLIFADSFGMYVHMWL